MNVDERPLLVVLWVLHHPTWVLLRGWFPLIAWAHIYTGSAFSVFPIPNATVVPFAWSGPVILIAATAIFRQVSGAHLDRDVNLGSAVEGDGGRRRRRWAASMSLSGSPLRAMQNIA